MEARFISNSTESGSVRSRDCANTSRTNVAFSLVRFLSDACTLILPTMENSSPDPRLLTFTHSAFQLFNAFSEAIDDSREAR